MPPEAIRLESICRKKKLAEQIDVFVIKCAVERPPKYCRREEKILNPDVGIERSVFDGWSEPIGNSA